MQADAEERFSSRLSSIDRLLCQAAKLQRPVGLGCRCSDHGLHLLPERARGASCDSRPFEGQQPSWHSAGRQTHRRPGCRRWGGCGSGKRLRRRQQWDVHGQESWRWVCPQSVLHRPGQLVRLVRPPEGFLGHAFCRHRKIIRLGLQGPVFKPRPHGRRRPGRWCWCGCQHVHRTHGRRRREAGDPTRHSNGSPHQRHNCTVVALIRRSLHDAVVQHVILRPGERHRLAADQPRDGFGAGRGGQGALVCKKGPTLDHRRKHIRWKEQLALDTDSLLRQTVWTNEQCERDVHVAIDLLVCLVRVESFRPVVARLGTSLVPQALAALGDAEVSAKRRQGALLLALPQRHLRILQDQFSEKDEAGLQSADAGAERKVAIPLDDVLVVGGDVPGACGRNLKSLRAIGDLEHAARRAQASLTCDECLATWHARASVHALLWRECRKLPHNGDGVPTRHAKSHRSVCNSGVREEVEGYGHNQRLLGLLTLVHDVHLHRLRRPLVRVLGVHVEDHRGDGIALASEHHAAIPLVCKLDCDAVAGVLNEELALDGRVVVVELLAWRFQPRRQGREVDGTLALAGGARAGFPIAAMVLVVEEEPISPGCCLLHHARPKEGGALPSCPQLARAGRERHRHKRCQRGHHEQKARGGSLQVPRHRSRRCSLEQRAGTHLVVENEPLVRMRRQQ
mmetsp:Transcript_50497/g.163440  ORF Transcript_50497/g.163440 Transcript_50497/m.163440 type:complete len:680 (+) Transcript_50497:19-2058(+)